MYACDTSTCPDTALLYVLEFDPASARFHYAVNGRFGASSAGNGGATVPFQIGLQARLTLGPNRTRDRLRASERGATAGPDSAAAPHLRSEERRVGKECRSGWHADHSRKNYSSRHTSRTTHAVWNVESRLVT